METPEHQLPPTSPVYSSSGGYEQTQVAPLIYDIPPLPPPPPAYKKESSVWKWIAIGTLFVIVIESAVFAEYVLVHPGTNAHTSLTPTVQTRADVPTPTQTPLPTPTPYTARDILNDFIHANLSVKSPQVVTSLPDNGPYPPSDIINFQVSFQTYLDGQYENVLRQFYIAVLENDAQATADAEDIRSLQHGGFPTYNKQRCLLLYSGDASMAVISSYWDVMTSACT